MNGKNFTIASLQGAGNVVSKLAGTLTFTTGSANANTIFSGSFNETAAVLNIVKVGSGKQILSGNSNYTGTTLINAGTLNIQNDGALGTSSMITLNAVNTFLELESTSSPINIESTPIKINGGLVNYPYESSTLKNISGDNIWSSNIILNGNTTDYDVSLKYQIISLTNKDVIYCNYLKKSQLTAFMLSLFVGFGSEHFYLEYYEVGAAKFVFYLFCFWFFG
jgi:autotransporter-associated beta strand protein